ncbi:MAG: hypothetical protein IKU57_04960 [Oscillospiraceae bacterium]|nr:hypothetical protein [Oscillospiraceae bacterium]
MARYPSVQYVSLYTDGSAARKLEVQTPVRKETRAKAKKQKKIVLYVDPVAILGIATAVIMLAIMAVSFVQLRGTQQEAAAMSSYVQELRAENKALRAEFEAGYDAEQIAYTAEALGMVPMDQVEHVKLDIEPQTTQEPAGVWDRVTAFLTGLFA